jgi:hypothetical protein
VLFITDITILITLNPRAVMVEGHTMISTEHFPTVITFPWKIFAFSATGIGTSSVEGRCIGFYVGRY